MDKLEESYMLLKAGEYSFLLPVEYIKRVADSRTQKEKIFLSNLAGVDGSGAQQELPEYLVLLEDAAGEDAGRPVQKQEECAAHRGILIKEVVGIKEVSRSQCFELPPQVLSAENSCICGAAVLEQDGAVLPAYIIDPRRLEYKEMQLWDQKVTDQS